MQVGSGTDPGEGAALAGALLDRLADSAALTYATTHHAQLKERPVRTPKPPPAYCFGLLDFFSCSLPVKWNGTNGQKYVHAFLIRQGAPPASELWHVLRRSMLALGGSAVVLFSPCSNRTCSIWVSLKNPHPDPLTFEPDLMWTSSPPSAAAAALAAVSACISPGPHHHLVRLVKGVEAQQSPNKGQSSQNPCFRSHEL